jgi:hypothetical protein
MVPVEVVQIGRQDRNVPESLIIDVVAIEVWRRWRDAEVRVGGVTASDAASRVGDFRPFRNGSQ